MKKLYTYNHKNITTCNDFQIKFKSYLDYLKSEFNNRELHNLFLSKQDFEIQDVTTFRNDFTIFFNIWLHRTFSITISSINELDQLLKKIQTTDSKFDEVFSYFNFYKKLEDRTLYVYDITLQDTERTLLEIIADTKATLQLDTSGKTFSQSILNQLIERKFIFIEDNKIYLTFKAKYAI